MTNRLKNTSRCALIAAGLALAGCAAAPAGPSSMTGGDDGLAYVDSGARAPVPADVKTITPTPSNDPRRCDEKGEEHCLSIQLMHLMHDNFLADVIERNRGDEGESVREHFGTSVAVPANARCGVMYFWMKPSWGDRDFPIDMMAEVRFSETGAQSFHPVTGIVDRGSLPTIDDPRYPQLKQPHYGLLGRPGPAGVGWTMDIEKVVPYIQFAMYCPCDRSSWPRRAAPGQREGIIWTASQFSSFIKRDYEYIIDPVLILPPEYDLGKVKVPRS